MSCNNFPFWVGHHHTMIDAVSHYVGASAVSSHCGVSDGVLNTTTGKLDCAAATSEFNATSVAAAAAMAGSADAVILVVGNGVGLASEGHDATNISFPDAQAQLIQQVAAAAKKPVVVVTMTASALDISSILSNPKVGAVLHAGEPAVSSLGAADVLFGATVPAGRTIQTYASCSSGRSFCLTFALSMPSRALVSGFTLLAGKTRSRSWIWGCGRGLPPSRAPTATPGAKGRPARTRQIQDGPTGSVRSIPHSPLSRKP